MASPDRLLELMGVDFAALGAWRLKYSTLYYGDWMARHERSHLGHIGRILKAVGRS